jgi:hypothetical protein
MAVNPAYLSGGFEFPGQPALKVSPMEDAFRVLAAYGTGVAAKKQAETSNFMDIMKTGIMAGAVDPDLSGGVSGGIKFRPIPLDERPDYIRAQQSRGTSLSALLMAGVDPKVALSSAGYNFSESDFAGNQKKKGSAAWLGDLASGFMGKAPTPAAKAISDLSATINSNPEFAQQYKQLASTPQGRAQLKLRFQKYGLHADEAEATIDEILRGING